MNSVRPGMALSAVLALTSLVWSQNASVPPSKHDGNGLGCASCHATLTDSPKGDDVDHGSDNRIFWDRDLLARSFQTYDRTATTDRNSGRKAASSGNAEVRLATMLCVSCHDGVNTQTIIGIGGGASKMTAGTAGLQKEHPVNVPMPRQPVLDTTYSPLTSVTQTLKLFGPGKTVQCSTCHDVHDSMDGMLLRQASKPSSLCVSCHL